MSGVFRDEEALPRPAACPLCETTAKWTEEFGLGCACPACGKQHRAKVAGEEQPRRGCYAEMDNLARWIPDILGKAVTLEAPIFVLPESHRSGTIGRMRPAEMGPDEEVVGGIDGLTLHVSSKRHGKASPGRPDHVDDACEQFAAAVLTLRRLDWLSQQPGGMRHVAIVVYAGLHHGEESRALWDRFSDDAMVYGEESSDHYRSQIGAEAFAPLEFVWRVGMVAASEATRAFWLEHTRLEMSWGFARALGRELLQQAFAAWAKVPAEPERNAAGRLHLGNALAACEAADRAVDEEIGEKLTAKVAWRRAKRREALS